MKKSRTRQILLIALAGCLAAFVYTANISAYLTDEQEVENTFTVGSVSVSFTGASVESTTVYTVPDMTLSLSPTVTNIGSVKAFVFVTVTVPYADIITVDDSGSQVASAETQLISYTVNSGWTQIAEEQSTDEDSSVGTTTYTYVYGTECSCTALAADASTGVLFDSAVTANYLAGQVSDSEAEAFAVKAYAIQTEGAEELCAADVWNLIEDSL